MVRRCAAYEVVRLISGLKQPSLPASLQLELSLSQHRLLEVCWGNLCSCPASVCIPILTSSLLEVSGKL